MCRERNEKEMLEHNLLAIIKQETLTQILTFQLQTGDKFK